VAIVDHRHVLVVLHSFLSASKCANLQRKQELAKRAKSLVLEWHRKFPQAPRQLPNSAVLRALNDVGQSIGLDLVHAVLQTLNQDQTTTQLHTGKVTVSYVRLRGTRL